MKLLCILSPHSWRRSSLVSMPLKLSLSMIESSKSLIPTLSALSAQINISSAVPATPRLDRITCIL